MKNEFVPYDIALAMRELGFADKCFGAYGSLNNFELHLYKRPTFIDYTSSSNKSCLAPLYQQAFRWFREEHNVDCYIEKDRKNRYWFYITVNTLINKSSKFCYHRYEKAELACLRKLIEIVKEKS